jgi:hypothetical protein
MGPEGGGVSEQTIHIAGMDLRVDFGDVPERVEELERRWKRMLELIPMNLRERLEALEDSEHTHPDEPDPEKQRPDPSVEASECDCCVCRAARALSRAHAKRDAHKFMCGPR